MNWPSFGAGLAFGITACITLSIGGTALLLAILGHDTPDGPWDTIDEDHRRLIEREGHL